MACYITSSQASIWCGGAVAHDGSRQWTAESKGKRECLSTEGLTLPRLRLRAARLLRGAASPSLEVASDGAEAECAQPPEAKGPLLILVPEVVGASSFRLQTFQTSDAGAAFIQSQGLLSRGLTAFWALHARPSIDSGAAAECVLLVGDDGKRGNVYVLSFLDMDAALPAARALVRDGLHLSALQIYWAAPVGIAADEQGQIQLRPPFAPLVPSHLGDSGIRPSIASWTSAVAPDAETARAREPEPATAETDGTGGLLPAEEAERLPGVSPEAQRGETAGQPDLASLHIVRRWEQRDQPFRGFDSPPGKF